MASKENISAQLSQRKLPDNNVALAAIFHRMADCYRYLGKEERFRAIAYENAARMLNNMKEDIADYATDIKSLDNIKDIGESIAEKIIEYLHTGKINTFNRLKSQVPVELVELMDITGFGPATIKILKERLHINKKEELIEALMSGKLTGIKGFGEKKIENMKRALKLFNENKRMPLAVAEKIGNEILEEIKKMEGVQKAGLAGSIRRKKETIGDIDIVILAEPKQRKKIVSLFTTLPQVKRILSKGITKASILLKKGTIQVDIRLVHRSEYGAAMLYFTGSKEHNIKLRIIARKRGFKINEYGIFDLQSGKRLAGSTEEEMYRFLNLKYIPPEQRLDKGEIENAVLN